MTWQLSCHGMCKIVTGSDHYISYLSNIFYECSVCSNFDSNVPIWTRFCTCHDSSAVMACAKLWHDLMTIFHVRATCISTSLRSWAHKLFVHDDVIKWKHFPHYWPFVQGIHSSPVNSPYKGQWRGALIFSLICVWINGPVNNREAGDLRRFHAHYEVIVM